jgi:hypothetical protein
VDNLILRNPQIKSLKNNNEIVPYQQLDRFVKIAYNVKESDHYMRRIAKGETPEKIAHVDLINGEIRSIEEFLAYVNRLDPFVVVVDVAQGLARDISDMNQRIQKVALDCAANAKQFNRIFIIIQHIRKRPSRIDRDGNVIIQKYTTLDDIAWDRAMVTAAQWVIAVDSKAPANPINDDDEIEEDHSNLSSGEKKRIIHCLKSSNDDTFMKEITIEFPQYRVK